MSMNLTVGQLVTAAGATKANAQTYVDHINDAMRAYRINTPLRVAGFIATVAHESQGLAKAEESLFYRSAERLVSIFPRAFSTVEEAEPYTKNPAALSQKLYGGFHGRGLIQLTWERNYRDCGNALCVNFVANPSQLCKPIYAALSAAWFWEVNGCNEAADKDDMDLITRIVNGPRKLGLEERKAAFWQAKKVVGVV